jgi:hypothetical protein
VGTLIRPVYATHRLPIDCILVARARAVRRTPLVGTSKCPTRYLHPRMVRRLPFFSARGHRRPSNASNLAHPLPVKTQLREIRSGLYNKRRLVELSNVETVGLQWTLGISDDGTVGQSDCPNVGQSECPTVSQCRTVGVSDSVPMLDSRSVRQCPNVGQSECPTVSQCRTVRVSNIFNRRTS